MVLCLKARESRSLPGPRNPLDRKPFASSPQCPHTTPAGWSSPVARQAHNLKVTGSNPVPATKPRTPRPQQDGAFVVAVPTGRSKNRSGRRRLSRQARPLPDARGVVAQAHDSDDRQQRKSPPSRKGKGDIEGPAPVILQR